MWVKVGMILANPGFVNSPEGEGTVSMHILSLGLPESASQ